MSAQEVGPLLVARTVAGPSGVRIGLRGRENRSRRIQPMAPGNMSARRVGSKELRTVQALFPSHRHHADAGA